MYSYSTLYYICKKMSVIFYNRKIFKKILTKGIFCAILKSEKIPRARGGLTARPCRCGSEPTFKLNQRGGVSYGRIAGTVRRRST